MRKKNLFVFKYSLTIEALCLLDSVCSITNLGSKQG